MSYVLERVHTDPRLRRRRKAVERTRRRKNFVRLVAVLTILVIVWALLWSPLLDVRNVEVRGAQHTSGKDVTEAMSLGSGINILRLSTDEIRDRIESLPWVKKASVARVLPGTLRVRIEEREAAMALSLGAAHWMVDANGRVLEAGKGDHLPVLAGADVEGIKVGMDIQAEQLVGGLRVYRSLSPEVQRKVAAIFAPTPERITLALKDGSQVRFGSAELLTAKSSVLHSLLRRLARDGTAASYIDLRVPTSPAVSPVLVPEAPVGEAVTTDPVATDPVVEVDPAAEVSTVDPTAETVLPDGTSTTAEDENADVTSAD